MAVCVYWRVWRFPHGIVQHRPADGYTETRFFDGTKVPARAQDTDDYRATAERLGYGSDTVRMSREHEFCHMFLAEKLNHAPSATLWAVAHGQDAEQPIHYAEEDLVCRFQAYLNGRGESAGVAWSGWAEEAREWLQA